MTLIIAKRNFAHITPLQNNAVYTLNIQPPSTSGNYEAIYKAIACLKLCLHAFSLIALLHTRPHFLFVYDESINFIVRDFISFFQQELFEFFFALRSSLFNSLFENSPNIFNWI